MLLYTNIVRHDRYYQIHPKTPVRKVRNRLNSVNKPYTIESSISRKILYGKSGSIRAVNGVCEYYLFAHAAAFAAAGQLSACFQDVGGKYAIPRSCLPTGRRGGWVLAKSGADRKHNTFGNGHSFNRCLTPPNEITGISQKGPATKLVTRPAGFEPATHGLEILFDADWRFYQAQTQRQPSHRVFFSSVCARPS